MKKIFYQSSMPRSGSSLLQNLIGQNPDFYVTPTSGLLELIYAARANYTHSPEFKAQDADLMKEAFLGFCRSGMQGYFDSITDKKYVMDKSRGWGIHYNLLNQINPNPKIVCIVRDLRDVVASMEKNYRKNQHLSDDITNHSSMKGTSIGKRVDIWLASQPVGLAIERVQEIINQGIHKNMCFIRYEDLILFPQRTMDVIYKFLEVDSFKHDFDNIPQLTKEDDSVYGIYGDHQIKPVLDTVVRHNYNEVLGEGISNFIKTKYDWYFKFFNY